MKLTDLLPDLAVPVLIRVDFFCEQDTVERGGSPCLRQCGACAREVAAANASGYVSTWGEDTQ